MANKETKTLHHYTNKETINKIKDTGVITQSPAGKTAVAGTGVYLTEMGPENSEKTIARNNYDDAESLPRKRINEGKVSNCVAIEFPKNDPHITKLNASDRDVHLHKGDIDLSKYKHSFKQVGSDQ